MEYNPGEFLDIFKREMRDQDLGTELKLHCALRVKYSDDTSNNYCNMFSEKIGINHLGDVFLCAWGGNIESKDNNFYIGNILEKDLKDLLIDDQKTTLLRQKISSKRRSCSVFSYLNSDDKIEDDMFNCNDPLTINTPSIKP